MPSRRFSTSLVAPLKRKREKINYADHIVPTSLRETLEAHRDANRASLIAWTVGPGKQRKPIRISPRHKQAKDPLPTSLRSRIEKHPLPELAISKPHSPKQAHIAKRWEITEDSLPAFVNPWLRYMEAGTTDARMHLKAEMLAFVKYILPSPEELQAAARAETDIIDGIEVAGPGFKVHSVGSRATGLARATSDIDLNLVYPGQSEHTRDQLLSMLNIVRRLFNTASELREKVSILAFVRQARVPILIGLHRETGLEFQIQSTAESYVNTRHTLDWVSEFPTLRDIYLILKQALSMRHPLCITSYPLLVMVLTSLRFSEGRFHREDIVNQLLYFLDLFSELDFSRWCFQFDPLGIEDLDSRTKAFTPANEIQLKSDSHLTGFDSDDADGGELTHPIRGPSQGFYGLMVRDPANPLNNVGRNVIAQLLQNTLQQMRRDLRQALGRWTGSSPEGSTTKSARSDDSLLSILVGGDYSLYETERGGLRQPNFHSVVRRVQPAKVSRYIAGEVSSARHFAPSP